MPPRPRFSPAQVRAAVRTLTLNVYQISDAAVQAFVVSQPASNYFTELAIFIAEQCQARARTLNPKYHALPHELTVFNAEQCRARARSSGCMRGTRALLGHACSGGAPHMCARRTLRHPCSAGACMQWRSPKYVRSAHAQAILCLGACNLDELDLLQVHGHQHIVEYNSDQVDCDQVGCCLCMCMPLTHAGRVRAQRLRQALDRQLSSLEAGTAAAAFSLESLLAEVEDLLSYCNDILGTGTPANPHLCMCFHSGGVVHSCMLRNVAMTPGHWHARQPCFSHVPSYCILGSICVCCVMVHARVVCHTYLVCICCNVAITTHIQHSNTGVLCRSACMPCAGEPQLVDQEKGLGSRSAGMQCAGEPQLAELLLQRLLDLFAGPVLLWPLLALRPAGAADAAARLSADPPLARGAAAAGAAAGGRRFHAKCGTLLVKGCSSYSHYIWPAVAPKSIL